MKRLLFTGLITSLFVSSQAAYAAPNPKPSRNQQTSAIVASESQIPVGQSFTYDLYIVDFAQSFIEIPTSNVSSDSSTTSSKYLAGRAAVYNENGEKVGTCSASFLCMQNTDGIYTDISNYLSVDSGLVVTWFTI